MCVSNLPRGSMPSSLLSTARRSVSVWISPFISRSASPRLAIATAARAAASSLSAGMMWKKGLAVTSPGKFLRLKFSGIKSQGSIKPSAVPRMRASSVARSVPHTTATRHLRPIALSEAVSAAKFKTGCIKNKGKGNKSLAKIVRQNILSKKNCAFL